MWLARAGYPEPAAVNYFPSAVNPSALAVDPSALAADPSTLAVNPPAPAVNPPAPAVTPSFAAVNLATLTSDFARGANTPKPGAFHLARPEYHNPQLADHPASPAKRKSCSAICLGCIPEPAKRQPSWHNLLRLWPLNARSANPVAPSVTTAPLRSRPRAPHNAIDVSKNREDRSHRVTIGSGMR